MSETMPRVARGVGKFAGSWRMIANGLRAAAFAFLCGVVLVNSFTRAPREKPPAATELACTQSSTPQPASTPCATTAQTASKDDDEWRSPELLEWENKHNGTPLPLNYDEETLKWGLAEGKVVVLPSGRTLASAGDTIYMLDAGRRRVLWEYSVGPPVIDFAYVEATGLVYATAFDNTMVILDAATGSQLYYNSRNGSAGYGDVITYGDDACLVMDNFAGYRLGRNYYPQMQDGVTAWRGTRILWHMDVPPDARLQVAGKKIYAVTTTKDRILVRELKVPKAAR